MKKITLLAAAALIVATSFSSCKKCITCSFSGSTSTEYCSKNKADRDAYETACKNSGGTASKK